MPILGSQGLGGGGGISTPEKIEFYSNLSSFPLVGSVDILYIAKDTGIDYIWNGASYISALNAKQNTLVSGTNIKTIEGQNILGTGNIDLNKSDVGLDNVDNTSDANKPVSTLTQTALNTKQNTLIANSINNALLSQMPANTIKVNATNATTNAQDLLVNPNSIVGRDNDINSGNITSIPLQKTLMGSATLIAGSVIVFDTNITVTSICVGIAISNTGSITSVPIRWTASAGQMTFNTGQIGDTATFGYIILI